MQVAYLTARSYLDKLADVGLLDKEKRGKSNYYTNPALIKLFTARAERL